jgi:tRNA modification GTPase
MQLGDTIVALATAPGPAGLAIVRVSGPDAFAVVARCFRRPRGRALHPRHLHYGQIVDPTSGEILDEGMACLLPAPHTYTAEASAEIHCHGGSVAPRRVLAAILAAGARSAEPGEFTLRAFLNGRLDLTQAEAVLDVVEARTDAQMRLALSGLRGDFATEVRNIRRLTMDTLAQLAATIDFPEDDVPEVDLHAAIEASRQAIADLLATADRGELLRTGARIALIGPPNSGKSTLLNRLLGRDRAIVASTPGTTRDTIEDSVNVDGIPLTFVDTAGLRDTVDPVESVGVGRARSALATADRVVLILDGSVPLEPDVARLIGTLSRAPDLIALNKADLGTTISPDDLARAGAFGAAMVAISALTGQGMAQFEKAFTAVLHRDGATVADEILVANARHRSLLAEALDHLTVLLDSHHAAVPPDAQAASLAAAIEALGQITGETATDQLLAAIFSRFCIGK